MDNKKRCSLDGKGRWPLNIKVLFRRDGSMDMGLDHLFRCKTLAEKLIENNVDFGDRVTWDLIGK